MFGVRGAPGNAINHATSYWVGNHSKRVFCDKVDIVCGIGTDKVDADNPAFRFAKVYRVVSNLGVFDFETPDHTMRLASFHPGVTVEEIVAATGFDLVIPDDVAETRLPTPEELDLVRSVLDPKSFRDKEIKS